MQAPAPMLELQPTVVGKRAADGWRVAMLRGGEVLAALPPYQARALAQQLRETADVLEEYQP